MRYLQESSFIRKFEGCEKLNSIRKVLRKITTRWIIYMDGPSRSRVKRLTAQFNEPTADSLLSLRALNLVQITANHIL